MISVTTTCADAVFAGKPVSAKRPVSVSTQIPADILENVELNEAIKALPSHYNVRVLCVVLFLVSVCAM